MPSFINNAAAIATPTEKAMVMLFTMRGKKNHSKETNTLTRKDKTLKHGGTYLQGRKGFLT